MTENEAIEELREQIETAESMISFNMDFEPKHDNSVLENKIKTAKMAISAFEEIQQYRAIGTVEECREARERQRGEKPNKDEYNHDCCPNCGWIVYQEKWGGRYFPHCENCGKAIDWSDII